MRLCKILDIILVVLLLSLFLLLNIAIAEDEIENKVNASIDIEFVTGIDLNVDIAMDVYQLTTDKTYDAAGIKSASEQELGAFRLKLYLMLEEQLEEIFANANILNFTMPTFDGDKFNEDFNVELTSSFFNLNESVNSEKFINGVLDIGAIVNYTFNLQTEQGWNNTYTIILSESIGYKRTTGSVENNRIQWEVKNGDGEHSSKLAEISIKLEDPTTPRLETEDIQLEFVLDSRDEKQTILTTNILIKSIDIGDYDIVPDFITDLEIIPSDGFRLFVDNGLSSWENLYNKTIKTIEEKAISKIENSSFNQTLDTTFRWGNNTTMNCLTPYETTNMDSNPPIRATSTDSDVNLQICNISSRSLFGLVNAGAQANISANDVNFGDNLDNIGYQFNGTLYLPDNLYLDGENAYSWNQSAPISGRFESGIATSYSNEKIDTLVEIEVSSTDLNLLSFFTGGTEMNLDLFLQETRKYGVTIVPDEFSLPEKISLDYLNADAFRLCVEEKVFGEDDTAIFLNGEKQLFESRLINILKLPEIDGSVDIDAFDESLDWDGDIANMDALMPVEVVSYAHNSYPVSFDISFLPPKFEISYQSFNFTGIQSQNVTYKMIFPHGTTVVVNDTLEKAVVKKTDDGREYIEITFDVSEFGLIDAVSCKIIPSALFIVGLFMPCIISLIITIILVVVIYIIRKKRKRKRGLITDEDGGDFDGYNGQDYYVPPPPSSKR